MFGIGAQELIIILVVALVVFGPKRLPELARSLGRGLAEFRRASSDLRQTLNQEPSSDSPETKKDAAPASIAAGSDPLPESRKPDSVPQSADVADVADSADSAESAEPVGSAESKLASDGKAAEKPSGSGSG